MTELSFYIHMLTTVYHIFLQSEWQAVFVTIGYVFTVRMFLHHVESETGFSYVRNSSKGHTRENKV